jgi:hypothetical protein
MNGVPVPRVDGSDLESVRAALDEHGTCVATLIDADRADLDEGHAAADAFAAGLATVIHVFANGPLWRHLGVDTSRPQDRSGGTGDQPPHMDFVNAALPPDYVFLYCARPDPLGGGASLVAPTRVVDDLPDHQRDQLRRAIFADGKVVDLLNIGTDLNPFAVLEEGARFPLRYTGKLLRSTDDAAALAALRTLADRVAEATVRVPVGPGEMLVLDQRRVLHGRAALGGDQRDVEPERRRLLLHGFGRDES